MLIRVAELYVIRFQDGTLLSDNWGIVFYKYRQNAEWFAADFGGEVVDFNDFSYCI